MNTAIINIKSDPKLKSKAQKVAADLGLSLATVINNYLSQFVTEQRVEFRHPLMPNKKTARELLEAERDIAAGRNISPAFSTSKEMDDYLDAL